MIVTEKSFLKRIAIIALLCVFTNAECRTVLTFTPAIGITPGDWDSTTLPVIDNNHYEYNASDSYQTNWMLGLFLGNEYYLTTDWAMQLGVSYFSSSLFNVKGYVTQGIEASASNQYPYHYHIKNNLLLLDSKWLYYWKDKYHPFIVAGIGMGFNRATGYQVDIPPCTTLSPQFANNNLKSLAYSIGFGIDIDAKPNVRLAFGYRFSDLGKAELGNGPIDTVANTYPLSQSHIYQSIIMVQLSYLF